MTAAAYLGFVGLCVLLALTPGPDTFVTLRFGMSRRAAGVASGVGSAVGTMVWAGLVAVGLAALLERSADAYRVVKIVGGLYLIYLGVSSFVRARHARTTGAATVAAPQTPGAGMGITRAFGAGMMSDVLNPKVGLFFLAIVPQFLPAHHQSLGWILLMGATVSVIAALYLAGVAFIANTAVRWLNRPRVSAWLERISSGILAALGVGTLALSATE